MVDDVFPAWTLDGGPELIFFVVEFESQVPRVGSPERKFFHGGPSLGEAGRPTSFKAQMIIAAQAEPGFVEEDYFKRHLLRWADNRRKRLRRPMGQWRRCWGR